MKIMYERCAAIDIAKKEVVVCLSLPKHQQSRSLMLVNPGDFKAVPGRKTDVKDAEWLADLLRYGLLRGSFVPKRDHRELRELVRYRKSLIEERARETNRLEKILEGANIKVSSVASTMTSVGVRGMLRAMVDGETDVKKLADMAKGRMRSKIDLLEQALSGLMGSHQRFMLAEHLGHIPSPPGPGDSVARSITSSRTKRSTPKKSPSSAIRVLARQLSGPERGTSVSPSLFPTTPAAVEPR
jgi:hypothetical protein